MSTQTVSSHDVPAEELVRNDQFQMAGRMCVVTETVPINGGDVMTLVRFYTLGTEPLETLGHMYVRRETPFNVFRHAPK